MATRDIQPPRQRTALDDEIEAAEHKVKDLARGRRIFWWTILIYVVIEIGLILIPVITHYPNWDYAPWAVGGIGFFVGFVVLLSLADDDNPLRRENYITAVTQLERLKVRKREQGTGRAKNRTTAYERYKESMPELIERYRIVANQHRRIYNSLQAFIIIGALTASTLAGAFESLNWARWAAVGLTAAVGISSAIGSHFKLSERSTEMQKTADLIEVEFRAVELGIGNYSELTHDEALRQFVERVERIRAEHMTKKRQLDQPADVRFVDASSVN